MPSLAATRAINSAYSFPQRPVALFVGGTSGIGQATAQAFARYTKGNAQIIICGRNRSAAESIISSFPKPAIAHDAPLHEFVHCDVSLMKNVHATAKDLSSRITKLNYLFISTGFLSWKGRDETEEGIDKKLAANYYSRWTFIHDLLPLLQKARDAGEDAKVMSVLAAGAGGAIDLEDLGLKKHFSLYNAAMASPTYNDLMIEEFASHFPDIAFTHIYPGIVRTPGIMPSHWVLRPFSPLFLCMLYPVSVSMAECGEHVLCALLAEKNGAHRKGPKGQDIGKTRYFCTDEAREKLWRHTVEVTNSL